MKERKLSQESIGLFVASFLLLDQIKFNTEFVYTLFRYIFIGIVKVNKIFTNSPDFNLPLILATVLVGYALLNHFLYKNKVFLICNQIFLGIYLTVCALPVLSGTYQLANSISIILYCANILIIIALNIINIKQIKNIKM